MLDSGFHKQKFLGFWNPDSLTWGDLCVESWRKLRIFLRQFRSFHLVLSFWVNTPNCNKVVIEKSKRQKVKLELISM